MAPVEWSIWERNKGCHIEGWLSYNLDWQLLCFREPYRLACSVRLKIHPSMEFFLIDEHRQEEENQHHTCLSTKEHHMASSIMTTIVDGCWIKSDIHIAIQRPITDLAEESRSKKENGVNQLLIKFVFKSDRQSKKKKVGIADLSRKGQLIGDEEVQVPT